ncbi:MAG: hypothetical protein P8Y35_06790 [Sulfurovaceae bacterium]
MGLFVLYSDFSITIFKDENHEIFRISFNCSFCNVDDHFNWGSGSVLLRVKDIKKASAILGDVLKNKPKENRWDHEELCSNDLSKRAFYETGG